MPGPEPIDPSMAQGLPPDPSMGPPGLGPVSPGIEAPPGAMGPLGGGPPDQDAMMVMLMQALSQKWASSEAQVAGEKGMLVDTMMQLAQPQPAFGPQDMVEGAPGAGLPPAGV